MMENNQMNEKTETQANQFSQNLSAAFRILTDIALHPANKENDIKAITECVLQKKIARDTNPELQSLRRELASTCNELFNEPANPAYYVQMQDQGNDIASSIDATKQKVTDLPEELKATESELKTSGNNYVLALADGNDVEQDEIEDSTNKCEAKASTLRKMIKGCHLSLELNNARLALLQKLLNDQQGKYKAVLFKPLQSELADATNEFCKVVERIYGVALVVPNLDNREPPHASDTKWDKRPEHPIIANILEQIIHSTHDHKALEVHSTAFNEASEADLSSNVDFEFSSK